MQINSIINRQGPIPPYAVSTAAATALVASITAIASAVLFAPSAVTVGATLTAVLLTALSITLFVKSRLQISTIADKPVHDRNVGTANIDILSMASGLFGKPEQQQLMPPYLNKISLENGDPLDIRENDLIVECRIWDCTLEDFPQGSVYLPIKLLSDKEFGSVISLRYEDKVIGLKLCKKYSKLPTLQEVCKSISAREIIHPIFGIYNSSDWFKWDQNASFYHWIKDSENNLVLTKLEADLAPKSIVQIRFDLLEKEEAYNIIAEFAGFSSLSQLNLIITEQELVIYGDRNKIDFERTFSGGEEESSYSYEMREISSEIALRIKWKELFNRSFEEMKNRLSDLAFSLRFGQLEIRLPKA